MKYLSLVRAKLTKLQPVLIWIMTAWFAHSMILNGARKLDPDGFWTNAFNDWGYAVWFRVLVGILEVGGGLLLLIPKVRHWGGLILAPVMVGALITRLIHGTVYDDAIFLVFVVASLLYFTSYLPSKTATPNT
ncbi:DoxX family protein [Flagellimonas sp. S3867]|uniref:DoxX family protein n=1 Tax=Flagellimonas sp. S3867 TaxID=2768063 RepID=UPI001686FD2A|nr:DoxX family protein [Flagellimonas sp. S3867]